MKESKSHLDKLLIASGFIGPVIFFLTVYFLFALLYPGYDPTNQTISELGNASSPVKTLTNVFGFSLFGIFIILFAYGVFRSKEIGVLGKIASVFFFLTGILMYLVGIFYSKSEYSILTSLHIIVANYQFPILTIGLVLFAFDVSGHKKLRWLTPIILPLGIITLVLAYYFLFTHDLPNRGIWQRAAIGIPYIIMMIISISLYKVQK
ncbi:MAG: DUF998 domain-containing protein [Nanoarchaeota archaeon]